MHDGVCEALGEQPLEFPVEHMCFCAHSASRLRAFILATAIVAAPPAINVRPAAAIAHEGRSDRVHVDPGSGLPLMHAGHAALQDLTLGPVAHASEQDLTPLVTVVT